MNRASKSLKVEETIRVTSLDKLSNDIEKLYLSDTCADVYFLVEDERIPGHKAILCSRSEYFRALLLSNMGESSKNEISLPLLSAKLFKKVLKFIYSGKLSFSSDDAFDLLEIANRFGKTAIEEAITSHLQENLTGKNIVDAFNAACLCSAKPLLDRCSHYFHEHIRSILRNGTFKSLSQASMKEILKEPVYVPDNILYNAMLGWSKCQDDNCDEIISTYLESHCLDSENKGIFLDLGTEKEVNYFEMELISECNQPTFSYSIECSLDRTSWTRIMDSKQYSVDVKSFCFPRQNIRYINLISDLLIRSFDMKYLPKIPILKTNLIHPSENVATAEMGATSTSAELLNGNTTEYDERHGFACHDIPNKEFLWVRLGQPYLIDSLRLLLRDRGSRYYHYYIDCSLDNEHWTRIVDRTKVMSRTWQNFVFSPTPMMYIKIAGTYNTENRWFHCVHFECPSQDKTKAVRL